MTLLWILLYIIAALLLIAGLLLLVRIKVTFSFIETFRVDIGIFNFTLKSFDTQTDESGQEKHAITEKKQKPKKEKAEKPSKEKSLSDYKKCVFEFFGKFKRYARLEHMRIKIIVSTDDAAKTAVLYGAVCALVASLTDIAVQIKNRSRKKEDLYSSVKPDFLAEKCDYYVSISFSLRMWHIFSCYKTLKQLAA